MFTSAYNYNRRGTITLEFSSVVHKDLNAGAAHAEEFLNALRRWLLASRTPIFWDFAQNLPRSKAKCNGAQPLKLFTVIRSPFVYKKTREQFGLKTRTYRLRLRLTKTQQNLFLQWLCQLKLPAELKIHVS